MKANRKFIKQDDEAVSPVIAVILMVAITVVLAATVYVWVSGFGAQSGNPAKSLSLSSSGPIASPAAGNFYKNFTVASSSSGMKYQDVKFTLNGADLTFDATGCTIDAVENYGACAGSTNRAAGDVVQAGDQVNLRSASTFSGKTLRVIDASSNSVILTLVVG